MAGQDEQDAGPCRWERMYARLQDRDDGRLWAEEDEDDLRELRAELRRVNGQDWPAMAKVGELSRVSHGQMIQLAAWLDDQLQARETR